MIISVSIAVAVGSFVVSALSFANSVYSRLLSDERDSRPILVFDNAEFREGAVTSWRVRNAGNGPALNVTVAGDRASEVTGDATVMALPAIPVDYAIPLNGLDGRNILVATYYDQSLRRCFTVECRNNRHQFSQRNKYPHLEAKALPRAFLDPDWRKTSRQDAALAPTGAKAASTGL